MALPPSGIPAADPEPQDATVANLTADSITADSATITTLTIPLAGELGGTTDAATVNAEHGGSTHAAVQAAAEATADTALSGHLADTTEVHGIDDTTVLATDTDIATHAAETANVHGITDTSVLATDAEVASAVTTHGNAADPHAGYQKESEKGAASGYASLDASTKVPIAQVPTGSTGSTVATGDHSHSALRFVPLDREAVFASAVTSTGVARTLTPAIASLPADAVLATGYVEISSDGAPSPGNFIGVFHTEAGTSDFATLIRNSTNATMSLTAPFAAGVIHSSGAKLSYQVGRTTNTITYSLYVTGYWTAA